MPGLKRGTSVEVSRSVRHRRRGHARGLPLLLVLLTATACTGGAKPQPSPDPTTPTTTTINGRQVNVKDVADVEAAVRGYFQAYESRGVNGLEDFSTGELKALASWQRILAGGQDAPPSLTVLSATIDSPKVTDLNGDTATVQITGKLDEIAPLFSTSTPKNTTTSTNISGAVTVVRTTRWQVADFHRGGQQATNQLFTQVQGQQASMGVTVKVIGVDLRPTGTVVVIDVNNTTALEVDLLNLAIKDTSGGRLRTPMGAPEGQNVEVLKVRPRSHGTQGLLYLAGLPANTRKFDLQIELLLGCTPTCVGTEQLRIPVQLVQ